jgi:hypothetical protein
MTQYTGDPFNDNIIHDIPKEIRDSFNSNQMEALHNALKKERLSARHLIDARFTIPLFFTSYYAVLVLGKDRQTHKKEMMTNRRRKAGVFSKVAILSLLFINGSIVLLALFFFIAYLAKSLLGIDIFPDKHLWDLIF